MAYPRAQPGERWLVRGVGWRVILTRWSDKHGRLYGIRHTARYYALTPVSSKQANWGRFVRSRDLIRRDKRIRRILPLDMNLQNSPQNDREQGSRV